MEHYIKIIILIILYSFFGWIGEVLYAYKNQKKFVNRGFLIGPLCPIYGFSAIILFSILNSLNSNIFILFIVSTVIISAIEYFTGFILEKTFKKKYWDYTEDPLNLHGRICFHFSLLWGGLAVLGAKYGHPLFNKLIYNTPSTLLYIIFYGIISLLFIDIIMTLNSLINFKKITTSFQIDFYSLKDYFNIKKYWVNRK